MPLPQRDHRWAYGLHIESDFSLPELPFLLADKIDNQPAVRIELGETLSRAQVAELIVPDAPVENMMHFGERNCRVLFTEVARVTLQNGNYVLVEPIEGTTSAAWRLPLLGSMLALLLEQRGLFALHAGAVQMPGPDGFVACAFAGEKGQGKSTLGASLSLAGFPLLCDDVLAVDVIAPHPMALSGFGSVKLVPDAVSAVVGRSPEELPAVAPELSEVAGLNKRHFETLLAPEPLPLRHVFLLASHDGPDRDDIEIRPLDPQNGLAMLLPHTFGVRWGDLYLRGKQGVAHLKACAKIVTTCKMWELSRRRDHGLLPATIAQIAEIARETR